MGELRPIIGDKRLGDIVIPAAHDAGTSGINENSHLIDRNFLFQLGDLVTPNVLVNWSRNHDKELEMQLHAGYRYFDLRIADAEIFNDTFRWWHGLSGDKIFDGLQQIHDFAVENKEEVLILEFRFFAAPGDSGTKPIPNHRKDEIVNILIEYLKPVAVPKSDFNDNPTMNEILASGRNVIIEMDDSYIEAKHDLFWPTFVHNIDTGRTNPEDLFEKVSQNLAETKNNYDHRITLVSGCATPDVYTVVSAMLRVYGDDPLIGAILDILLPGVTDLEPDLMSFEGVYVDLLNQHKFGINTGGMLVRPADNYTNGASIQYMG